MGYVQVKAWFYSATANHFQCQKAIEQYFSAWQTALYAQLSQSAIIQIATALSKVSNPRLTVSSLLSAIITSYSVNEDTDEWLIAILPTGAAATSLDVGQVYLATPLGDLLGEVLLNLSTNFLGGGFSLLAQHGQMMNLTTNWMYTLEDSLAGLNISGYAGT